MRSCCVRVGSVDASMFCRRRRRIACPSFMSRRKCAYFSTPGTPKVAPAAPVAMMRRSYSSQNSFPPLHLVLLHPTPSAVPRQSTRRSSGRTSSAAAV